MIFFCLAVESHKSCACVTILHKTHTKFSYVRTYVRTYEQPAHSTQYIKAHTTQARQARPPRPTKVQQGITLSRLTCSSCACSWHPLGAWANHPRACPLDPPRQRGIKSFLPCGPLQGRLRIKHLCIPCKDNTCGSSKQHKSIAIAVMRFCLAEVHCCQVLHWGKLSFYLIVM